MSPVIILAAFAGGVLSLIVARRNVRGTTLVATWWWSLAAFVAVVGLELLMSWQLAVDTAVTEALRYATRVLLLCPTISLLGVKRPQHGPWNFIVLSLWGVLALPAAQSLLLNSGQPLEIQSFFAWFLLLLIFVTLANTLPTRHWPAALLTVIGQFLLQSGHLPFSLPKAWAPTAIGVSTLAAAAWIYVLQPPRKSAATTLDHLWLDFRDSFGLFWGLRVQERIQAAAKMYQWPVTLHWTGWKTAQGQPLQQELADDQRREIMVTFRGLLRRFVSNDWIDSRLGR